jgi:hypothetical protein
MHWALYWMHPLSFTLNATTQCYSDCSHSTLHRMQPLNFILNAATQRYTRIDGIHYNAELFCHIHWQFAVSLWLRQRYPVDGHQSDRNMWQLIVCDVIKHILYVCICWFAYTSVNTPLMHDMEHTRCTAVCCSLCAYYGTEYEDVI